MSMKLIENVNVMQQNKIIFHGKCKIFMIPEAFVQNKFYCFD